MKVACIPHSQIPGSSALFQDYLYRFDRVEQFYRHPPELASAAKAAAEIQLPPQRRAALVKALRAQNPRLRIYGVGGAAMRDARTPPDPAPMTNKS